MSRDSAVVSVVVPFRNPGPHFVPLLDSLVSQGAGDAVEVIAVDNLSTDGSRAVAESYRERIPITIVSAPARANASYARNVGVRAASGEKLLFSDADDELAPGYVAAMSSALDEHEFVTSRPDPLALNPEWVRGVFGPPWMDVFYVAPGFLPATGPNVGIRRPLLERAGGWPEEFSGSQDIAFAWRVQLAGAALHTVHDAVYRYRFRLTLPALLRQTMNWGYSNVLLYRRFGSSGMASRPLRASARDWALAVGGLAAARSRSQLGAAVVALGYCFGRFAGSVRYRRIYL